MKQGRLFSLLFPDKCVFCARIYKGGGVCDACARELPYTGGRCAVKVRFTERCVAPLYYTGKAREAMLRFKFSGKGGYAPTFAFFMADCIKRELDGKYDVITWIPISGRRRRKRGYVQTELLAAALADELGVENMNLLKKLRHTPKQSQLRTESERVANVSGAFGVVNHSMVAGRRVLLVDDIVTTGATMAEAARVLLLAGAQSVYGAAVCRARKYGSGNKNG